MAFSSLLIRRYWSDPFRRSRRQDVKYGNPIRQCRGFNSNGKMFSAKAQLEIKCRSKKCTLWPFAFGHTWSLVTMEILPLSLSLFTPLQPIRTLWRWCSTGWREAARSWSVRPALHTPSSSGIYKETTATAGKRWAMSIKHNTGPELDLVAFQHISSWHILTRILFCCVLPSCSICSLTKMTPSVIPLQLSWLNDSDSDWVMADFLRRPLGGKTHKGQLWKIPLLWCSTLRHQLNFYCEAT